MSNLASFFDMDSDHDNRVKDFVDNMNLLKSLTVEEHTLYKKWEDLNYNFNQEISNIRIVKNKIWKPTDLYNKEVTINQIQNLKPKIVLIDSSEIYDWNIVRAFCHTMSFDANIGRNLKFLVIDEASGKYLGCLNIGSDVIAIKDRDSLIGWTKENRLDNKKINNTAIGSCIMATQPFGYNFLGGKLMACLITSETVRKAWENKYIDKLVGFTTTSLYGSYSMYNGIPYWKHAGSSAGKINIKPDDKVYLYFLNYIKTHHRDEYDKIYTANNAVGVSSGVKQRLLAMIFKIVGLSPSKYTHGYQRGVYFSSIYENTKEFLCNKISESELKISERYSKDTDGMLEWWKKKAISRYEKLHQENRLNNDTLFYEDLIGISWIEAKQKYLSQVGR